MLQPLNQWLADVDAKMADGKPHWGWLMLLPLWQMEWPPRMEWLSIMADVAFVADVIATGSTVYICLLYYIYSFILFYFIFYCFHSSFI